jgi:DNA-binding NarL/FixJ family response regulator
VSPIRVVLVGGADMLQDVIRQVVDDDPALMLVGEVATVEGLPGLWEQAEADVVVVRSLSADVPAAVLPAGAAAHIPAVLGVDHRGTRGVIILDDVSRTRLAAAIRATAELRAHEETN